MATQRKTKTQLKPGNLKTASAAPPLTERQRQVLDFIDQEIRERGYPPSVREIGEAVGLSSPSTVHAHLAQLQDKGYLKRDASKPRAIDVQLEVTTGSAAERRPVRHVPLLGDVAAGTGVLAAENVEELVPMPTDMTGDGELFMVRVRGDSMIEMGIFDGDYVVARTQATAENGDVVVAGIPGEEATIKTFLNRRNKIVLRPANEDFADIVLDAGDVQIYGKVVTLMRKFYARLNEALTFYATAAPITALPFREFPDQLADLPRDVAAAGELVRGVLIHRDWAPILGQQFSPERVADEHRRSMREVVTGVVALVDAPLTVERPLPDRMVAVCRHFATMHVALMRHAGIPARARVGFGGYFEAGWVDHWITEWWNGERWVRSDEQIFPQAAEVLGLTFDAHDQPAGEFLTGAEAWQRCRHGEEDPNQFGIFDLRGLFFIVGSMIQDLAALNKVELLPWDMWGSPDHGPGWQPTADELVHLDALAALLLRDDLTELRARFAEPDVAIPTTITSFVNGTPTPVDLDPAWLQV